MGDGNSRSDNRRNRSSEEPADANNIVLEFQDELVSAEEGLLDSTPQERRQQKRQVHSIAHLDIIEKRIVYIHIDLEHGGTKCGILQISLVFMDADLNIIGENDWYVKPPDDAEWDEHACAPHGLKPSSPEIANAKSLVEVWSEFKKEVEGSLSGNKVGTFVA